METAKELLIKKEETVEKITVTEALKKLQGKEKGITKEEQEDLESRLFKYFKKWKTEQIEKNLHVRNGIIEDVLVKAANRFVKEIKGGKPLKEAREDASRLYMLEFATHSSRKTVWNGQKI